MKKDKLYKIWDQVPVTYYQQGTKRNFLQQAWHQHKLRIAKSIIKKLSVKKCLDIGCASGHMISEIAKTFPNIQYYGVDIYDKAILFAQKKYPNITFKISGADRLPFRKKGFDLILCYETIEHVEFPLECLKESKRVLTDSGTLILSMDSGSLLFRLVWLVWENTTGRVWKGAHLHPFHHIELESLVKKAGFRIDQKIFSFLGMEVTFILRKP